MVPESSGDILADGQTHRQTYSSQYFATAPAGEVIRPGADYPCSRAVFTGSMDGRAPAVTARGIGSPLVIGVEDTEDSKPKDGRR